MFGALMRRFHDVKTIRFLSERAESLANANGQSEPGAEHFVMAALELPDGTAERAFRRLNAQPELFSTAIATQYRDALRDIGIEWPQENSPIENGVSVPPSGGLYKAKVSGQALMQKLPELRHLNPTGPLLGAHVVLAATSSEYGVTPRALQSMGIDRASLAAAARAEITNVQAT